MNVLNGSSYRSLASILVFRTVLYLAARVIVGSVIDFHCHELRFHNLAATVHAKNAEKFGTLLCSIPYALALLLAIASFVFKSRVLLAIDIAAITHFFVSKSVPQVIVGKFPLPLG